MPSQLTRGELMQTLKFTLGITVPSTPFQLILLIFLIKKVCTDYWRHAKDKSNITAVASDKTRRKLQDRQRPQYSEDKEFEHTRKPVSDRDCGYGLRRTKTSTCLFADARSSFARSQQKSTQHQRKLAMPRRRSCHALDLLYYRRKLEIQDLRCLRARIERLVSTLDTCLSQSNSYLPIMRTDAEDPVAAHVEAERGIRIDAKYLRDRLEEWENWLMWDMHTIGSGRSELIASYGKEMPVEKRALNLMRDLEKLYRTKFDVERGRLKTIRRQQNEAAQAKTEPETEAVMKVEERKDSALEMQSEIGKMF